MSTLRRLIIVPRRLTYRPPPLLDPLNCLEARSGSFWTLSPRLFWEEEEEEEKKKKEDEEVLR